MVVASAGVALLALGLAFVIWKWGRTHKWAMWVVTVLMLVVGAGISGVIGGWFRGGLSWLNGQFGNATAWAFGASIAWLVPFLLVVFLIFKLWPKKGHPDGKTALVALVLAPLAVLIPGITGELVTTVVSLPAQGMNALFSGVTS